MLEGKKLAAIVTAAGSGIRMNNKTNKPYIEIAGKKIVEIVLDTLASIDEIDAIVMVIRKDDEDLAKELIKKYKKDIKYVYGRQTREESTIAGLNELDSQFELVLTHDGVRPFASRQLFIKTINELKSYKAVITATKAKDTVKLVNEDMTVDFTPDRRYVYNVQTPQAFDKKSLLEAYKIYETSDKLITDDSQLFEIFTNNQVKVIEGEYSNIKITTPEDIAFAKALMEEIWE